MFPTLLYRCSLTSSPWSHKSWERYWRPFYMFKEWYLWYPFSFLSLWARPILDFSSEALTFHRLCPEIRLDPEYFSQQFNILPLAMGARALLSFDQNPITKAQSLPAFRKRWSPPQIIQKKMRSLNHSPSFFYLIIAWHVIRPLFI